MKNISINLLYIKRGIIYFLKKMKKYFHIYIFLIINCPFNNNTICEYKIKNVLLIVKGEYFPNINKKKIFLLIYQNHIFIYFEIGKISSKNNNNINEIIIIR